MNSVAEDTGTGGGQGCGGIPVHPEFQWVHSVLDQTGLGGSPSWQMNQANIDDPHVQEELFSYDKPHVEEEPFDYELPIQQEPSGNDHAVEEKPCVQEDSFDYELPVQQEPSKYDHLVQEEPFDYELPIQQEPSEYDLPADEERDNLPERDDFDEGAVSLGVKHDNFALAESSDMWTSANDPATVEQPSHPTPVRRSISEPMPFSPASPPPSPPPMSQ